MSDQVDGLVSCSFFTCNTATSLHLSRFPGRRKVAPLLEFLVLHSRTFRSFDCCSTHPFSIIVDSRKDWEDIISSGSLLLLHMKRLERGEMRRLILVG